MLPPSTDVRHWTLLLPHRQKLLRLPYRRGSGSSPEAHRGYLRSLQQDTLHRRSGRTFGDDSAGLLSAPLLIARCTVRACLLVKQCGCNGLMRT